MQITSDNAADAVHRYLQLCEDRRFEEAAAFWGPGPLHMVFPGGVTFDSFAELASDASRRYAWVRKHRDRFLVGAGEQPGELSITSMGRLYGENLHGESFSDVRYVDVFIVRDGALREQLVWNDLAITGALGGSGRTGGSGDPDERAA